MAFEEHKKRKFQFGNPYADYEYVNKNSRKTGRGLLLSILFGLAMLVIAWYRLQYIGDAELTGGTVRLTTIEWGIYKVGGKWAVACVLVALGILFIAGGILNYRRLEKIKQS